MKKQATIKSSILTAAVVTGLFTSAVMAMTPVQLTDADGDGVISAQEIADARDAKKAETLAQFDADGNGELSRDERRSMKDARYESMLSQFDADGDGELSKEEKSAAKDVRRASTDAMLDVNGDGELSAEETAGIEQAKDERGDRKKGKRGGKRDSK